MLILHLVVSHRMLFRQSGLSSGYLIVVLSSSDITSGCGLSHTGAISSGGL